MSLSKETILAVDDDPISLIFIDKILSPAYNIIKAKDGKEGMNMALQKKPDLIISDLYMPEVDGDKLAGMTKQHPKLKDVPFIIVTSSKQQKEKINSLMEVDDFITKPYDPRELFLRVGNLLKMTKLQRELEEDLQMAQKIQSLILNSDKPSQDDHIVFDIQYFPQSKIGGDLYNIYKMDNGVYRFFLADATGHGVQAALMTMIISSEYQRLKKFVDSPAQLLNILNNEMVFVYGYLNLFFTCFVADIDLNNKTITYASAGHPKQKLFIHNELKTLSAPGKIIGILENSVYENQVTPFDDSFQLFLFSNGITEQFNPKKEMLKDDVLYAIMQENLSIQEKNQKILETLKNFSEGIGFSDDVTLIGIEV